MGLERRLTLGGIWLQSLTTFFPLLFKIPFPVPCSSLPTSLKHFHTDLLIFMPTLPLVSIYILIRPSVCIHRLKKQHLFIVFFRSKLFLTGTNTVSVRTVSWEVKELLCCNKAILNFLLQYRTWC